MKEYHKIETIYERDTNGTKRLIEGQFRNEAVEYLRHNVWAFTEKIDGTNIRIHWDGHTISFAGRTDKAQIPNYLMEHLNKVFSNGATEELFEQMFGEKEVILFGEGYGPKIQKVGSLYRPDVSFILFDVMINGIYLNYVDVKSIARSLGIDVVPVVLVGSLYDAVDYVKTSPNSTIGSAPMEGVVGRPLVEVLDRRGNRVIVKIKVCDFVK